MPRSRKRHHSRSRSKTRSRSPSRDRSHDKQKKPNSNEKDGKRRRLDDVIDSPQQKRSLSSNDDEQRLQDVEHPSITTPKRDDDVKSMKLDSDTICNTEVQDCQKPESNKLNENNSEFLPDVSGEKIDVSKETANEESKTRENDEIVTSDSDTVQMEVIYDKKETLTTPKKPATPKQVQKKLESEKKKLQKQKEREERERQRQDEKAKILAEKQKIKEQKEAERQKILEEKQKQLDIKQKEKELKEQKRKEKEEQEAQKRKEKEQEKLKRQQEIEEKNKEKQKEEEKKQKTAALFKNFFKKTGAEEKEMKSEKYNSNFMPFEVKSDMRLPPLRRPPLSYDDKQKFESAMQNQDENTSYLKELKCAKVQPGKSSKTWPYEDLEEELMIIEEDKNLGETICEDAAVVHKMKAKFLFFHENRRPAYFGTWRKKSKVIKSRRPFEEDTDHFNYEEDSDDDWEEEEQGESLDISGDEDEKDAENEEDDYEVDNEFFVPHGHLSDDEVDDEENARLSPESLKQKLKLLKDEFEEDMKSKTHKLKPRSIGVVWCNRQGNNVKDAIYRYLQPFAMIVKGTIEIEKRAEEIASPVEKRKVKAVIELPKEHIPHFLKIIHGNVNKKRTVIEEFLTNMANNGFNVDVSKANLTRFLKMSATYKRCTDNGPLKNKFGWFVNDDIKDKYNVNLDLSKTEN